MATAPTAHVPATSPSADGGLTAAELTDRHQATLDQALEAITTRAYWSPHPEHPKAYGENGTQSAEEGRAAFQALLNRPFELHQPGTDELVLEL